jgi:hypothetical protein
MRDLENLCSSSLSPPELREGYQLWPTSADTYLQDSFAKWLVGISNGRHSRAISSAAKRLIEKARSTGSRLKISARQTLRR